MAFRCCDPPRRTGLPAAPFAAVARRMCVSAHATASSKNLGRRGAAVQRSALVKGMACPSAEEARPSPPLRPSRCRLRCCMCCCWKGGSPRPSEEAGGHYGAAAKPSARRGACRAVASGRLHRHRAHWYCHRASAASPRSRCSHASPSTQCGRGRGQRCSARHEEPFAGHL